MARAIVMMAHASTPAMRKGVFPERDDDAALSMLRRDAVDAALPGILDDRAREELDGARHDAAFLSLTSAYVRVCCAPSVIALASARGLGLATEQIALDTALAAPRYGEWAGRSALDIGRQDPAALQSWTRDPYFTPPGGESFDTVRRRLTVWLAATMKDDADTVDSGDDALPVLAIASAPVVRAAVLLARRAQLEDFHSVVVGPCARFTL